MDNDNNQGGKFSNGFLLGLLVGAAVVFLLGTKKGKRLLKSISEEGMENISSILEEENKSENFNEASKEEEPSNARASKGKELTGEIKKEDAVKNVIKKPAARRFFRGISRHVN